MLEWIAHHENSLRPGVFFSLLLVMGVWEFYAPKKRPTQPKAYRWFHNLTLVFANSFIVKLLLPMGATAFALYVEQNNWGVFHNIPLPIWISIPLTLVIFDFIIYWQHRMMHVVPFFWQMHQVHHADLDIDVSTGSRFHILEILFSMGVKFISILLIGPHVVAVILFEIFLNGFAMFNHSNINLPKFIDSFLRFCIVTPDVHRIHHSQISKESYSNYGFNIIWWDRIFGSYLATPELGHANMQIGIAKLNNPKEVTSIWAMCLLAFKKPK
jgi:sterol desaturase/sphingolipid hydroxylase (fatty acid hydroxylase superfamily)